MDQRDFVESNHDNATVTKPFRERQRSVSSDTGPIPANGRATDRAGSGKQVSFVTPVDLNRGTPDGNRLG